MLQTVQQQYSNIEDLNDELTNAFDRLKEDLPSLIVPDIYTQIGSFDQSIIVSGRSLGICLDKYLGADYPFYQTHYSDQQRRMMVRQMIVPDCLSFYILSLFPIPQKAKTQQERDSHIGCIQWLVNRATGRDVFQNEFVRAAGQLIEQDSRMTIEQLLRR